jgi:uncharacterized membrane protein YkvA (DUF1232 family)
LDDVVLLTLLVSEVSQVLIEGAKARQGEKVASNTGEAATGEATQKTVDVDSVSV